MFIHQPTGYTIHADLNKTLVNNPEKPQIVLYRLLSALKETPDYPLFYNRIPANALFNRYHKFWKQEESTDLIYEISDKLKYYAPHEYYFDAIGEDYTNYGFWKHKDPYNLEHFSYTPNPSGNGVQIWELSSEPSTDIPIATISEMGSITYHTENFPIPNHWEIHKVAIHNMRKGIKRYPTATEERYPVIVETFYEKNNSHVGIQFWTPEMIDKKENPNSDHTVSAYLELLAPIYKHTPRCNVKLIDWVNYFNDRFAVVVVGEQSDYSSTFSDALTLFNGY